MMKASTTLKCPVDALIDVALNFEVRMGWDKNMTEMKSYEMAHDMSAGRISYRFLSPAPLVLSDRDFYIF